MQTYLLYHSKYDARHYQGVDGGIRFTLKMMLVFEEVVDGQLVVDMHDM